LARQALCFSKVEFEFELDFLSVKALSYRLGLGDGRIEALGPTRGE